MVDLGLRAGLCSIALTMLACGGGSGVETPPVAADESQNLLFPGEVHFRNVRQLTFGGENAEGYFSPDGKRLIFQSKRGELGCDQIFIMDLETLEVEMVSTGGGKCTCAYFLSGGDGIVYSSTHLAGAECPPPPDYSKGYVWKLDESLEIFSAARDGSDLRQLTDNPGYDAEATVSPDGSRIIFTSLRDGDLDLYTMKTDGTDLRRITTELGYDGGAFYSRDGRRIVWRASRPQTDEEKAAYADLLATSMIRPMNLEVYVADADGGNARRVTDNGAANFAPYFFPDGKRIIFASNVNGGGRNFDLHMINEDGTGLEQITFNPTFDGFPMFSPDGRYLVFASNRNNEQEGDTNLFLAEWVD